MMAVLTAAYSAVMRVDSLVAMKAEQRADYLAADSAVKMAVS